MIETLLFGQNSCILDISFKMYEVSKSIPAVKSQKIFEQNCCISLELTSSRNSKCSNCGENTTAFHLELLNLTIKLLFKKLLH